jgi:hypothetical protein
MRLHKKSSILARWLKSNILKYNKIKTSTDKVFYKNQIIGIRFRILLSGSIPLTDKEEPLQMVSLKHPGGAYLKAHMHKPRQRITKRLQECLVVKRGKVKLDLYGPDKKFFKYIYLSAGDVFLLMLGGIGIHIIKDAEMIEIKNGPFKEDKVLI